MRITVGNDKDALGTTSLLQNGDHRESLEGSLQAESDGQAPWSKNQAIMLVTYNKYNLISWNKRVKDSGNKQKIAIPSDHPIREKNRP